MRRPVPILILSASLVLTACGGGGKGGGKSSDDPETAVRATLATFVNSIAKRDYATLCNKVFAPKLLQGLQSIGLPCEVAMRNSTGSLEGLRLTVGEVTVNGDTATAQIRTSATGQTPASSVIALTKINGEWRVSARSPASASTPTGSASPSATLTPTPTAPAASATPTS